MTLVIHFTPYGNACTQMCVKRTAQLFERRENEEAQQVVQDAIKGIAWEGFDCLVDWMEFVKMSLEDLQKGSAWVRIKIREQLNA